MLNFVTALILAGGQSRRMGTDKALLLWEGTPLLQRVAATAAQCDTAVYVLTPWPERYRALLSPSTHWILETSTFNGPMVALSRGFEVIPTPWIWLLACDLPQLDPTILQPWLHALPQHEPDQIAYVPQVQNRWEPLCGFYHRNSLSSLQKFLSEQGNCASFQTWLHHIHAVPFIGDAAVSKMLHNCNTPRDLKAQPIPSIQPIDGRA